MAPGVTRIVCVSDTHSKHTFAVPDGDILLHAGDFSSIGQKQEVADFVRWLRSLPHRIKIVIAGNHDLIYHTSFYEKNWARFHPRKENAEQVKSMLNSDELRATHGVVYLEDSSFTDHLTGWKFYGSPWQPWFGGWAFNLKGRDELKSKWSAISPNTDILLTHGPPSGILDANEHEKSCGCKELLSQVPQIRPKLHVFGHIHESYGQGTRDGIIYVNASTCTLDYEPINPPIVIDLPSRDPLLAFYQG